MRREIYQKIKKNQPDKVFSSDELFKMANKECKERFAQQLNQIC